MADRTVSVRLRMTVQDFMRNGAAASAQVSRLAGQLEDLDGKKVRPKIDIDVDKNRIQGAVAGLAGVATGEAARHSSGIFRAMFTPNPAVLRTLRTGIPAALSSPIGVAGLALGATFAASFAAAVVSAGLFAGIGAGFTGLAAVILRENERVRSAFDQTGDTIQADLREAAQPLVPVFDDALSQVETMFGPHIADPLEDIFTGLGPSITPAVESAVRTIGTVLDELATPEFLSGMQAVLDEISAQMPRLGQGIGDALVTIAENGDDIAEAFGNVVTVLNGVIGFSADAVNAFTDVFNVISDAASELRDFNDEVNTLIADVQRINEATGVEFKTSGADNPLDWLFRLGTADLQTAGQMLLGTADAAKGVGEEAALASGRVKKFASDTRQSGSAALTAAAQLEDYKERAQELADGLRLMSGLRRDSIRAGLDVQQTVTEASRALVDAESAVADARSAAGDAARDAAEAERQAQQRIADAQERVTDARESAARAAEQAAERVANANEQLADARESAARAAEQAAERVANAEERLADTQVRAREAQEGLTQARRDAARALADMRENVSDLALSEESAEIGLIEARRQLSEVDQNSADIEVAASALAAAQQQLSEVQADDSATWADRMNAMIRVSEARDRLTQAEEAGADIALERRKAELGVLQAEDQLSDVRRDQTEATEELNEAERRGISGSEQVVEAKRRIADANETVREAHEAVRDAVENERRTREESAEAIREAQEVVRRAIRDERRTQQASAEAIRDAIAGVDEARRNAARTAEESAARIADAARRVREAEQAANRVREQVRLRMLDIADAAEAEALALFEETGQQDLATEALERGRKKLIGVGIEYGLTRGKAEDYADQIIGTPTEWTTLFKQRGLDNVKDKVEKLADKIIELEDKTIVITANGSVLVNGKRAGGRLAQGGPIDGPGTPTSDSIPVWASDGEFMMNAAARRKYGDDVMHAINSGQLAIGGPASNTVTVRGKDGINAADFGLMAERIAIMAAESSFTSGKVLPPGSYRIGRGTRGHGYPALDLPAPIGTPIYSMAAGIVSRAMRLATSYGTHAFVDHPGERQSRYAHMSSMNVGLGDEVRKGQLLGRVGSTGNSTGPHLHFEALVHGLRRDPKHLGIFHRGGMSRDDQPAVLKRGEFVVQAPAVQQLGIPAMQQINQGQMPGGDGATAGGSRPTINVENFHAAPNMSVDEVAERFWFLTKARG